MGFRDFREHAYGQYTNVGLLDGTAVGVSVPGEAVGVAAKLPSPTLDKATLCMVPLVSPWSVSELMPLLITIWPLP